MERVECMLVALQCRNREHRCPPPAIVAAASRRGLQRHDCGWRGGCHMSAPPKCHTCTVGTSAPALDQGYRSLCSSLYRSASFGLVVLSGVCRLLVLLCCAGGFGGLCCAFVCAVFVVACARYP
mmetsp:Transcript_39361/g.126278  ORF Transcript_39361/g.126278 Transcript_39361/m.126278 type:complete len:124 (-) Transcript_39361:30-401(-)